MLKNRIIPIKLNASDYNVCTNKYVNLDRILYWNTKRTMEAFTIINGELVVHTIIAHLLNV